MEVIQRQFGIAAKKGQPLCCDKELTFYLHPAKSFYGYLLFSV
jgi:hypothetical protein